MICMDKVVIEGIPALKIEQDQSIGKPLPLVLFWHGWTSLKERNLYYAYLLAAEGIRVIMPDAMGHGERAHEFTEEERQTAIFPAIMKSVEETKVIWDYCENQGWILDGRFSLAGTSMGAMITLSALSVFEGIKSGVSLMGAPYLVGYARHVLAQYKDAGYTIPYSEAEINYLMQELVSFDLSRTPEKIKGVPLLFWHGKRDPIVPYAQSRLFYDSFHSEADYHMSFLSDPEAEHVVSQVGAIGMRDWFVNYL
ncbi:alpha/beta fold hydrolase [Pullulanibacillus sp. KACC 23026]|uniref:alpha/beta fold hydrolase n=1 Tax=Pullulanibacillus sp. KACC 23026 TaxID=3028315 RepID=UPI0023AF5E83|nr:alpha/beta fold hydrolase [Pullulanibacillus sp. KACC 23026]WEG11943.1 alpha/beta fold hydrolase [Pullulanibacillus sp. KACC 23026]